MSRSIYICWLLGTDTANNLITINLVYNEYNTNNNLINFIEYIKNYLNYYKFTIIKNTIIQDIEPRCFIKNETTGLMFYYNIHMNFDLFIKNYYNIHLQTIEDVNRIIKQYLTVKNIKADYKFEINSYY